MENVFTFYVKIYERFQENINDVIMNRKTDVKTFDAYFLLNNDDFDKKNSKYILRLVLAQKFSNK